MKKCCKDKHIDLLLIGEEGKGTMFLSKISVYSCMITHYTVEERIFTVIVYKLLEQQKQWNVTLKIALKLIVNKGLRCQNMVNTLDSKKYEN